MRAESSLIVKHAELVGSSGIMEDRIFIGNKSVVVLDGATQADQTIKQTGGWIAGQIGQRFSRYIETSNDEVELTELLAQAIADTRDEFNLVPGKSPSTTVCAARFGSRKIDLLVLGDSPALCGGPGIPTELQVLEDRRLSRVSKILKKPSATQDDGKEWCEYYQSLATSRNRLGGFWIVEAEPGAALHALTQTVAPDSTIAVCTDGVSSMVRRYSLMGWQQLFKATRQPANLVKDIEVVETSDPLRVEYPRSKVSDDKVVANMAWQPS